MFLHRHAITEDRNLSVVIVNVIFQRIKTVFKLDEMAAIDESELLNLINTKLTKAEIPKCESQSQVDACLKAVTRELGDEEVTHRLEKLGDIKGQIQRLGLPKNIQVGPTHRGAYCLLERCTNIGLVPR